jgi:GDP-mannose 6-dehydrogenase
MVGRLAIVARSVRRLNVAVIGLGRVGLVTAAALAAAGRKVTGVDSDPRVLRVLAAGRAHFSEPGLTALLRQARARGGLTASSDVSSAAGAEVVFVCVGTPALPGGRLNLSGVAAVCRALARLPAPRGGRVIAVRSTLPPGTCRDLLAPSLPRAARRGLVLVPDFSREGDALSDGASPTRLVVGAASAAAGRKAARALGQRGARVFATDWTTAELAKSSDNAFHALKAAFANELAVLSDALGADGLKTLEIVRADSRLNASAAYLHPGDAFGGPCLEKDLRALVRAARHAGGAPTLLGGVLASNERRLDELAARAARGARRAAVLDLSFKRGTRDRRGSIALALARRLAALGLSVRVHDAGLAAGSPAGKGVRVCVSAAEAAAGADVVLLGPGAGRLAREAARGKRRFQLR